MLVSITARQTERFRIWRRAACSSIENRDLILPQSAKEGGRILTRAGFGLISGKEEEVPEVPN